MRYTLRQLEYFIAAGETGSITAASERVHISQPSISTAISSLEQQFGVQLFVRHHAQGLSLTPAGRNVLSAAKTLIEQAEALTTVASECGEQVRGRLSLGCFVTLAPMLAPELVHSFTTSFPKTQVHLVEGNQAQLLDKLRNAEIDVALTYDLQMDSSFTFTPLAKLPPHILVGETHRFASRKVMSLEDLVDEPMSLLDLPASTDYFMALFYNAGLTPKIGLRSAHHEVVRTMVANGHGYTISNVRPRSDMALDGRKLVRIRLAGDHMPMKIGCVTLAQLRRSRLVQAFESHCGAVISDGYIPGMVSTVLDQRKT
jgi:DNA-binding transcriptional LysR family regulator